MTNEIPLERILRELAAVRFWDALSSVLRRKDGHAYPTVVNER